MYSVTSIKLLKREKSKITFVFLFANIQNFVFNWGAVLRPGCTALPHSVFLFWLQDKVDIWIRHTPAIHLKPNAKWTSLHKCTHAANFWVFFQSFLNARYFIHNFWVCSLRGRPPLYIPSFAKQNKTKRMNKENSAVQAVYKLWQQSC